VNEVEGSGVDAAELSASRARLTSAQIARMSRLLEEALSLDEAGRLEWLEALSPEYHDIAQALREALSPGIQTPGVLATLPKIGSDGEVGSTTPSGFEPGARVGPYELIKLLGAGGMAEVWLARRADGAFKREVALKLPMLTRLRKGLEERFARERDILASLEHPNIARLYDAGMDAEGLPYLSMEYVRGQPITAWCDEHRLGIAERLQLMLQVLAGVHYAHERQVIHRDLKPSNILVSEAGDVRLLDFGVAKLLQTDEVDQTQITSVYGRAFTPDYASPELIQGDAVDARSDIYSLGVLLYELLTGTRPYRLNARASVGTLEQAIVTVEVSKPSTQLAEEAHSVRATTHERLVRQLRGDLDVIVLKSLAKDAEERYESASSMAQDLQRHLHSEAIRAQPPRLSYRLRKFVRRHRTGMAVAALMTSTILATVGYEIHRVTVNQAREIAALPTAKPLGEKSIAVLPFIDLSEKTDQGYFSDGLSEELIDLLAQVKDLKVIARTSSFYFKGKPVTIAQIAKALGVDNVLQGSVRRAGNTLRVNAQLIRADTGYHLWSETYDRELNDVFKLQDEIADSVVKALKMSLLNGATPRATPTASSEAYTLYLQARTIFSHGSHLDHQKAADYLQQALALDPKFAPAWAEMAAIQISEFGGVGTNDSYQSIRAKALTYAQQSLKLDPNLSAGHVALGRILYYMDWNSNAADEELKRALEIDPGNASALRTAASVAMTLGHLDQALHLAQSAAAHDPISVWGYYYIGAVEQVRGRLKEAETAFRTALDLNPGGPKMRTYLGLNLLAQGRATEALAQIELEPSDIDRQWGLAAAFDALGRKSDADQAFAELEKKYAADGAANIASAYACRKDLARAFAWLDRAYQQRDAYLLYLKGDSCFKNLRPDPRYKAFLRKMNLPE
jgi:eukaryotic-like serine/threonine-protein kinase